MSPAEGGLDGPLRATPWKGMAPAKPALEQEGSQVSLDSFRQRR